MADATPEALHEARAVALATEGITLGVDRRFGDARQAWQTASDYADVHLAGRSVDHWIKSGLGAALYDAGDYERAILVSRSALVWCMGQRAVLPSLTIAKSLLKLGDREGALAHVRQARRLRGDRVIEVLDDEDRHEMRDGSGA